MTEHIEEAINENKEEGSLGEQQEVFKGKDSKYNKIMQQIGKWTSFYRENPTRFIKDYLGIKIKMFQEILITMMWFSMYIFAVACRGISKTWTTALFASTWAMLYPGVNIIVASGTRKQARELVSKIEKDFMVNYPMFAFEVEDIVNNQYNTVVKFRGGSTIEVVTANENARCGRAQILIIDEARLVDKGIIDSVLSKFLTNQRHAGYMDYDKYQNLPLERNKRIYLTSAWYASHWCYTLFRDYAAPMVCGNDEYMAVALPYQLSIKERLLDRRDVEAEMNSTDFNEISWLMEMCAEFWAGAAGSLYQYDEIMPCRTLTYAYYPKEIASLVPDKRIAIPPKMHNEVRVMSVDIALMQSRGSKKNNDATSIFLNCMFLDGNGGRSKKKLKFTKNSEGLRAEEQALEIRRLFNDFDADWLVIDGRGLGLPIVDMLMDNMYDPVRNVVYSAIDCYNNEDFSKRCKVPGSPKKIWVMLGNRDINSQCALTLREEIKQGNIEMLVSEEDVDEIFASIDGYQKLSLEQQYLLKAPYYNTTLAIHELISLETETKGNYVTIKETTGARKDRYSSLSYNIWVCNQLEKEYENNADKSFDALAYLYFRQPVL